MDFDEEMRAYRDRVARRRSGRRGEGRRKVDKVERPKWWEPSADSLIVGGLLAVAAYVIALLRE